MLDAAGKLVEDLADRRAERDLKDAGMVDIARHADELRTNRLTAAARGVDASSSSSRCGTSESVSTLLRQVGRAKTPLTLMNGGFMRGRPPCLQSSGSRAVPSPQT